ncbi:aldehyde dehydrogenase family protein [Ohtaekwangia kribbensis]|jgi:aldehyde dehydrogenase (NAD+)|uniref:Aldehyde dehydrogenase n=1 Tax=Ohtaekwangia kribbensis TaxID=688913 RepID=A0ABW3K8Z6_9BACT
MQAIADTDVKNVIHEAFKLHHDSLHVMRTEPLRQRKVYLKKLRDWIHANRTLIHEAAYNDFKKPAVEVDGTEIFHVLSEIKLAVSSLETWAQPRKVDAPITMLGTRSYIQPEPRGICLIISPWNYPFSLAVGPLVSAIAAGNSVILKPSELTPHVSAVLSRMVKDIFPVNRVSVFEGGPEVSQHLLKLPFDHIFFTGSPAIGKVVMKAAAENLTSVTLELGGKSPTIVTASANIKEAAQRIAVAKFINNGQTCVAPDYILVDESVKQSLIEELKLYIRKHFAAGGDVFDTSASYCRIVNEKHFSRVNELLKDTLYHGAKLEFGGSIDEATRFIHPVILSHVPVDARLMEEEIFGPILPVISYTHIDEAVQIINTKPKALALYIFTRSKSDRRKIIQETSSGAICINDCAVHFLQHNLPFGGVNNSGIGSSHGYFGFQAFSHDKPVMKQKGGFTSIQPFYPPYTSLSKKLMDWFLKLF